MSGRCPERKLAAPRQRPSAPRPREEGCWRRMAGRPTRATRRAASGLSGPPAGRGEWRSPRSATLVWVCSSADERMSIRHAGFAYKSASITLSRSRSTAGSDQLSAALPREMPQWHALLRSWRVAAKLAGSSLNKKGLSDSSDSLRTHLQSIGKFGPADKKECPEKLASHSRQNFLKSTRRTQNAKSIYDYFTLRGFSTFAILVYLMRPVYGAARSPAWLADTGRRGGLVSDHGSDRDHRGRGGGAGDSDAAGR
jgi:hypothetical protein